MNQSHALSGLSATKIKPLRTFLLACTLLVVSNCSSTTYENTTKPLRITTAPIGVKKIKIVLVEFRNFTGKAYLAKPATAQLTTILIKSGYFEVIDPALSANILAGQSSITTERLAELKEKFGADYFLTGSLTNFEIREGNFGFCLLFGLLGAYKQREYIVETGVDYRLISTTSAKIISADHIENRRTDKSRAASFLFSKGGSSIRVLRSNSGKLLRYAMRDLSEKLIATLRK